MGRITAIAVTAVTIATVLSGCSISRSPYCQAVEDHQELLSSFDSDRSDAGYTAYARAWLPSLQKHLLRPRRTGRSSPT